MDLSGFANLVLALSAIVSLVSLVIVVVGMFSMNQLVHPCWFYLRRIPAVIVFQIIGLIIGSITGGMTFTELVKSHPFGHVGYQPFMAQGMVIGALVGTFLGWLFVAWPRKQK